MARRDAFSTCHPWVSFLFFALTIFFSMCFMDPASLAASFLTILPETAMMRDLRDYRMLAYAIVLILVMLATNSPVLKNFFGKLLRGKDEAEKGGAKQ